MDDMTNDYRFQRLLIEAAQYRTIRKIIDADREIDPGPLVDSKDRADDEKK